MQATSPFVTHINAIGVKLSYLLSDDRKADGSIAVMTFSAYEKRAARNPYLKLRAAHGKGNEVLLRFDALPEEWRAMLIGKYGQPTIVTNALDEHFTLSGTARMYFDSYITPEGNALTPEQVNKYTLMASMLDAVVCLKQARESQRKRLGGSTRGVWKTLMADAQAFNGILATRYGMQHKLPKAERHFKDRIKVWQTMGYDSVIDGRIGNDNARIVTPEMEALWNDMYSGQKHKPYFKDVATDYQAFLDGKKEVINASTGELYDRTDSFFREVDGRNIQKYLMKWKSRVATQSKRSGNRQRFLVQNVPHAKLIRPEWAGSIISVDDRQPPFKFATGGGNRMWMYIAQDLGSDAITCWVHGETKEGIITDFYRQLVRNYTEWGVAMPHSLECESSLNASFRDTFLSPGAMFQDVRIIANDARSKRIERTFRAFRYDHEKKEDAFIPRVTSKSEANQERPGKEVLMSKEDIIQTELKMIADWNNALHPDQALHPGLTRWDVFLDKQNPKLQPTNWRGLLPTLGHTTKTSMNLGRVKLQGMMRVVSQNGVDVALGDDLIRIMEKVEGQNVNCYWMDDTNGKVLRAIIFDMHGNYICELMDDLPYHRAVIEQTDKCRENMRLTAAYRETVEGHMRRAMKGLNTTVVMDVEHVPTEGRFVMPRLKVFAPRTTEAEVMPAIAPMPTPQPSKINTSTASRF